MDHWLACQDGWIKYDARWIGHRFFLKLRHFTAVLFNCQVSAVYLQGQLAAADCASFHPGTSGPRR